MFDNFEVCHVAQYGAGKMEELMADPGIVRNRAKLTSAIENTRRSLKVGPLRESVAPQTTCAKLKGKGTLREVREYIIGWLL